MTEKQTYWMTDTSGVKALVAGADERDRWRPHGYADTADPVAGDLVWLQHDVSGGRQVFAAEAAEQWAGLGWHPSAPPEPVDLTKDPMLVDQAPAAVLRLESPAAEESAPKTTSKSRAASGETKE
jgi:hypothetical protein